ncbi:amino acid permease [Candidatus Kirkpatrickella diaphorinae]|uniref:Amino acid permease n=2 Tax=Candidatus Kirkpatrickella diaphorinae TaxID=2984322 RepID=A0ABY6GL02_9PROT|nr:amino acid permease [Candidatus Kirkpatrickella diaphorinae]UYH52220.1 amino acid permease [Candidatus Kirkpatrickella diaphorinae]
MPSRRKTLVQIERDFKDRSLKQTLSATQLTLLGVGSTVGAGIYVMTGMAASQYAGPAVLISFIIAAVACLFTALCYGELAASMPVSGSAYSYAYVSMGERAAWVTGWLLLLEYGISCIAVASGLSGYASSLAGAFHIHVPAWFYTSTLITNVTAEATRIGFDWRINGVGALAVCLITFFLVIGVQETARLNAIVVCIKVGVLLLFIGFGVFAISPHNWVPFMPHNEGGFRYGWGGVFRAASVIFFAYVGFEAVSTAATEARNPRRDVPIGIIGSLAICTIIYLGVAVVLLGIVPYRQLDVADPLAIAVSKMHAPFLTLCVNIGATVGLCSVLLGLLYGQSRILYAMSRDGLISPLFSHVHPRFRTPWTGTIILGICVAVGTATLPIDVISEIVSIGTALAFAMVCFTVIWQRNHAPDAPRPFEVPLGGVVIRGYWLGVTPMLGIALSGVMMIPLVVDVGRDALVGNPLPVILLFAYAMLGALIYMVYSRQHSRFHPTTVNAEVDGNEA